MMNTHIVCRKKATGLIVFTCMYERGGETVVLISI